MTNDQISSKWVGPWCLVVGASILVVCSNPAANARFPLISTIAIMHSTAVSTCHRRRIARSVDIFGGTVTSMITLSISVSAMVVKKISFPSSRRKALTTFCVRHVGTPIVGMTKKRAWPTIPVNRSSPNSMHSCIVRRKWALSGEIMKIATTANQSRTAGTPTSSANRATARIVRTVTGFRKRVIASTAAFCMNANGAMQHLIVHGAMALDTSKIAGTALIRLFSKDAAVADIASSVRIFANANTASETSN